MKLYQIKNEIIESLPSSIRIWGNVSFGTLYDPVQNLKIHISNYNMKDEDWNNIKTILKNKFKAKSFRKVGNNLCFYIKGIEDLPSYARK